ncbi:hypothetical protein [Cerasicoccus maritimus]|uniref:hypothetical protein n=1 Tax=Cerasicoccus maritimus TaxID=490089 RepID=UPI00285294DD|nr:hypothetical protein [Cerasicoccus maritimus]
MNAGPLRRDILRNLFQLIRAIRSFIIVGVVTMLAGCGSTQEHRARQYSEAYGRLSPAEQERALAGGISQGDSMQAVYIALGSPQAHRKIENITIWEYTARPVPAETPFTDSATEYFITPNSGAWSPQWNDNSGYLYMEFEDGKLDLWDFQEAGFSFKMQHGGEIKMPE